jgi:hypothetical protein
MAGRRVSSSWRGSATSSKSRPLAADRDPPWTRASRSGLPRQRGPAAGRDRRLAHGGGEGGAGGQLAAAAAAAAAAAWVLSQEEGESRAMGGFGYAVQVCASVMGREKLLRIVSMHALPVALLARIA